MRPRRGRGRGPWPVVAGVLLLGAANGPRSPWGLGFAASESWAAPFQWPGNGLATGERAPAALGGHRALAWWRATREGASAQLEAWKAMPLVQELNATVQRASEAWGRQWRIVAERRQLFLAARSGGEASSPAWRGHGRRRSAQELQAQCLSAARRALQLLDDPGWVLVAEVHRVKIWRQYLAAEEVSPWAVEAGQGQQLVPVVLASGVLDVDDETVFNVLKDNKYVSEYNDNCKVVMDLEKIDRDTRITWAATNRFGPFKARDFCTLIHFKVMESTKVVVNFAVQHPRAPPSSSYVRSEILLAATVLRRREDGKTELTTLTCINPGGAADSRAGAVVLNSLSTNTPATFIRKLEATSLRHQPGPSRDSLQSLRDWWRGLSAVLEETTRSGTTWGCF